MFNSTRIGNGREWSVHGLEDFLEVKSIMGYNPAE
jgi:acyl-CoA reductase-like NAD-dependent aldehyde dehydrogenase